MTKLLLIGYGSEGTFAHFRDFVAAEHVDHAVIDLGALRTAHDLTITEAAGELTISIDDDVWKLSEYTAIYARAYWFETGTPGRDRALRALVGALQAFLEHTPALVVNRPSSGASNSNKLVHLRHLAEVGLRSPTAHVLGDAELARTIVAPDGEWISKSCSSVKTKAAVIDDALYARLGRLAICPSLFQRRVRGADVRVHVVGSQCIAERIVSDQIDYRYREPGASRPQFSPCDTPPAIATSLVAYCDRHRLLFAGADFKVDDAGTWYALEVNPMPGYDPYDRRLDKRISRALLDLLVRPSSPSAGGDDDEPFVTRARRPLASPFA